MNNRRNLKENLTISNKQRFSIRKFSIGVASVMLGTTLYFMGGVGTSIVHADSVQGQSVQTSKLDTNSAQASSDASSAEQTSSQNQTSSAQNSQKAVSNASSNTESTDSKTQTSDQVDNATTDKNEASQADNANATNIKTRDNKKVVSDANRAKSTANDAQTKPAQQTAKSDAANSNTLVVQRTKKLTVNAKLLADSKAQTDTKTDSNYSVTDNYPKDLMNYLPSDFNNKQEYAFEWLRNENNNNIILTTNRTGDGEVYVYQDGEKVGTLAQNSLYPLPLYDNIWGDEIGTVYNDDYAGIVESNHYLLNIIYSSHAKDVDNAGSSYSTVDFFVPHKIKQTVTYKDSKDNVIDRLTHTQYGLTGQSYTTGWPSGPTYVQQHQYLDNITHNGNGLISEFHDGYICTENYHDGVSVTFTEKDSEKTGTGTMDYVIYDHDWVAQRGSLAYGKSTNYTNDSGIYTIVNPYVPQTTNIVYQYKELGNVVNIDPKGKTTKTQYKNDPNDPTKVKSINVPSIPGYTTLVNGKTVSAKTIMPADPGQDTTITYSANDQSTTAKFVDDDNKGAQVGDTVTLNGKTDQTINTGLKVPDNYELAKDQTLPATYKFKANGNEPIVIHLVHATKPDTNDNDLNKTVTRTINVKNPDGTTTTIKQEAHLHRSGTIDEVTQKATYQPWTTDNWAEYDTPSISGYTPSPAKVSATTVDGNTQDQTVTITYVANDQSTTAKFVDDDNKGAQVGDTVTLNGKTDQTINTGLKVPDNYELAKDQTLPATYKFKANGNEPIVIHLVHATKPDTNDNDLNKTVTRTINVKNPDGTTTTIKQEAHLHRSGTIDEVTQKATYQPWTTDNWAEYDTPSISGYTPSPAKVSATTVDGNTQDQTVTITYVANDQSTTAKFVDDDNKGAQVGDTVTLNGKTDQTINTGLKVPDNYELAKDQTLPATYKFKANGNEPIVIHLVHATKPDTNDNDLNKTVTRTINVKNPDGTTTTIKQEAHLHRSGTIDEVTQKATYQPWTTDNWAEYDTPSISGYTPSPAKVSATTVDGNTQDQTVTITYVANDQSTTAKFVDDDNKGAQVGDTVTLNGKTDQTINTGLKVPDNYELAKDQTLPATYKFKANGNEPIVIHLVHATKPDTNDNDLNKTVTRTINVKNPDGTTTTIKQEAHLHRSGTIDEVTQKATYQPWTTDNWAEYDTPSISGYTPSPAKVSATTVDGNTQDQTVTITYVANDQSTTAKFVDDDNKGAQVGDTVTLNGKTDQTINTGLKVPDNYELAKDQTLPATYKFKANGNEPIVIHLVHATKPDTNDNDLNKTVTRTINVKNPDGTTTTIKQEAHLHRSGTIDEVTQKATYQPWTTDNWAEYDTPSISGYTPSPAKVSATTVDGNTQDQTVTITYVANDQSTTAKFVDDDNKGAQVGDTVTLNGKTDQTINTGLKVPDNYELAKDQTLPATYKFKANGNEPIVIHLVHATKPDTNDNDLNKTVTRTINVKNPDGTTTTIKQEAHLHRSGTIDEVTQKATYQPWTTDNWAEYDTPSISGYTPSPAKVSATTVDGNTQDQTVTITYVANDQSTTAKFVDDDNKGAQVGDTVTLNGKTDQTINTGLKVPDNYELAKDQTLPATYKFKANGNEPIVIHLVHATKPDTNDNDLNKTVTRTINVKNPDGTTTTIKQEAHLHRSGTIDEVTQKATYQPWTTDNWAEYDTPSISGYTPSPAKVSATTVDGNTQDQTVTITYVANDQSTTAKFVDDDNKGAQVGDTVTLNGKTDQTINTGLKVPDNYELAKDQTLPATYKFKANGNEPIVIHLVHATKPDTNDNDLNKTVTRTINVKNPDGTTTTIKQEAHLHRSGTIDEVTQKATYQPWTTDNWAEYDTPSISGYTPSPAKVSATTVDGNTQDQTVTITYVANDQSTTAKFVDDDNKGAQVGDTVTLNGKTDQTINTGLKVPDNYELAKDQTLPATYKFKANGNEPIVIHLVHATKPDTNDNDLNKTVTRTINVKNPDGTTTTIKQEAHLHRSGTIDEVTQKATYQPWTTDNWAEYDTPSISGYTPSPAKVSATTVDGNTQDQTVTITYVANDQSTTAKFVDDDNKGAQVGDTVTLNGKTDQTINTGLKVPDNYELAKDQTLPATYKFKANGNEPIVIHLVHATKPDTNDNDLNKTVTRTINVKNPDGTTTTIKQEAHLHRSGTIDEVTQKATYQPWTTDNWAEYDTPSISGYTPSPAKVSATTVDGNTQDQTVTITYVANDQSTTAKFVDDDNKGAQVGDTVTLNGKTDQTINTGLKVPDNYELAKDQTLPATYKFKANGNEPIVIHLVHATKPDTNDNDLNKTVTRTINVKNPDGTTTTIKQEAHLHRSGTIDEVTQKATYQPWTTDNWAEYDTPSISGYTPSPAKVSATTVDGNTQDQTVTITYVANDQSTTAKFVDDDNKGAQVGDTVTLNGKTDQTINTGLKVPDNYELAKDQTLPATYKFKANGNEPIVIHLVHATKPDTNDNDLNKTVTRTINVKNPDGTTTTIKQEAHLHRSGTIDEVTQKATYQPWTTDNWAEYDTPSISGYTPSPAKVSATTVDGNTQDQTVTITYVANDQSTTAKFVDDDNKGAQVGDTVTLNGKTDQTINTGLKVPDNYELAKDQTLPATYKFKANGNEPIVIHLVHATKPDTNDNDLNKTVTRTINVKNPDGTTTTIKQEAHLHRSGTIDEVTQKATYQPWTTDNWAEYDTPSISGYTPSPAKVSATTVDGNTQDQTVTITYSADKQKASVTYVDDKTGKTLKVDNLNGVTNAKSGYTTKAAIDTYTGLGYTLVSDDTNGKEVVFDNDDAVDQAFTVHLSHGTITVTPENPGKPGEPVDPDNPDGPKYPDGTEEYQVKRTGTQTIHYVGAGDKTPADNKQTFIFTREITFDNVTGKIISVTPWNVKSHTFGSVDTPIIPGYHADKAVAGGATVTPDDLNNVITVTYIPDGGNGDNPGSNGGGDQDDTPTPEPTSDNQPDTKLPSDNNTDKDVEKDKQDKPEEVKKARKIIKTRITKQEHIGNAEKAEPLAEQEHNDQTVASPVKNEANEPQLPQTGEANTSVIGLLGMLVAGFAAILGFESSRSRKHKN